MKKIFLITLAMLVFIYFGYYFFKNDDSSKSLKKISAGMKNKSAPTQSNGTNNEQEIVLTIQTPEENSIFNSQALLVVGKTAPNADVFINDIEVTADSTGSFFANIILDEGENTLLIVTNDEFGNYAEKELVVYLESTE